MAVSNKTVTVTSLAVLFVKRQPITIEVLFVAQVYTVVGEPELLDILDAVFLRNVLANLSSECDCHSYSSSI